MGAVCLSLGMMGTQGLEEEAFGEGTTSKRLLSVFNSNSKLVSLSWDKMNEPTIQGETISTVCIFVFLFFKLFVFLYFGFWYFVA